MLVEEFYRDLMNTVDTRAEVENDYRSVSFLEEVSERLAETGEVENLSVIHFSGAGEKNRRLAVDGFDLGDQDGSVALAVLAFSDGNEPKTLSTTDARKTLRSLENFLDEAVLGVFQAGREESGPEYQLAEDLRMRGRNVTRYRMYLITNMQMSGRAKAFESSDRNGIRVDYHIWDLQRLLQVHQSTQGREELEIDLTEWLPGGLPALRTTDTSNDVKTYLTAIPARVLADLYGRYGSRLLEGNVRSYLSTAVKVNKGIRTTVLSEPERFLAYNNGITATATDTGWTADGRAILSVRDLQIVNGGQTTATLFYVRRDNKEVRHFDDVFVQAKIVVIQPDQAVEMVPRISRYANSQNKVSEADFFSNSPFHVRLEELSRRILAPAQPGVNYQTKWFYERTRGQYSNEQRKLHAADVRKFVATFPRAQVITKTDAAKYEVSWAKKPYMVSAGAQRNFLAFAEHVAARWEVSDADFNEVYFKHLVAKAILFNRVRALVAKADWYQSGYLANIVAYTMAKLAVLVETQAPGRSFDFDAVWNLQTIATAMDSASLVVARTVLACLTDESRPIVNVTEWAKREGCWDMVRAAPVTLPPEFFETLTSRDRVAERRSTAAATQRIDNGIHAQARVLELGPAGWESVRQFVVAKRLATPTHVGILDVASGRRGRAVPSERQSVVLLAILKTAQDNGFDLAT
jgi:AIPR protein